MAYLWENLLHNRSEEQIQQSITCRECGNMASQIFAKRVVWVCPNCQATQSACFSINHFEIDGYLDHGGNGAVFFAHTPYVPGQIYALKVIVPGEGDWDEQVLLLRREGLYTHQFAGNAHTVQVAECDSSDDFAYLATEYVKGENLYKKIRRKGPLPLEEALVLLMDVVKVLLTIHSRGFLYRDLKPQNVLVTPERRAVLCDFGLCLEQVDAEVSQEGSDVEGSPHYLPPERLTGSGEDVRSEIYSLGLVFFFALTGENLFEGIGAQEIAEKHLYESADAHLDVRLPLNVCHQTKQMLSAMLRKKPARRLNSLMEVKSTVKLILATNRDTSPEANTITIIRRNLNLPEKRNQEKNKRQ